MLRPSSVGELRGKVFSDDVLLAVPPTAAPGFVLRLAPGAQPITCSSKVPSSVTRVGGVTDFQVMCTASSLPSVFAPTLEVYVKPTAPTFLPVTLRNAAYATASTLLPFVVGAVLATIALGLAVA
ncbi:MAG: hypothetical protein JOY58_14720 [Solirubrobacterales bacterium]|nr:hypothetical protein [Solirubrobacterales bacterium]